MNVKVYSRQELNQRMIDLLGQGLTHALTDGGHT